MTDLNHQTLIYLLSPSISYYDPLLETLTKLKQVELRILHINALKHGYPISHNHLLLVDARINENTLLHLQTHPILQQAKASALIYAPTVPNLALLSIWHNLSGYFYDSISSHEFCECTLKIAAGNNCLPKVLLVELIQYWQALNKQQDHKDIQARLSLTKREIEILSHLQMTHSNLDIADLLFVSEHTIKSHLYRIFKKLNVRNRRQAINWAQMYLTSVKTGT